MHDVEGKVDPFEIVGVAGVGKGPVYECDKGCDDERIEQLDLILIQWTFVRVGDERKLSALAPILRSDRRADLFGEVEEVIAFAKLVEVDRGEFACVSDDIARIEIGVNDADVVFPLSKARHGIPDGHFGAVSVRYWTALGLRRKHPGPKSQLASSWRHEKSRGGWNLSAALCNWAIISAAAMKKLSARERTR